MNHLVNWLKCGSSHGMCMTFRHRDPRWGKLIETTEVKRGEVRKVGRSCDQRSPEVHAEEGLSA